MAPAKQSRNWVSWLITTLYILFMMIPVYWLIVMSFKDNNEIMNSFSVLPQQPTLRNYGVIFTDFSWYVGYINSTIYVVMNMIISLALALPAAYAFSRYRFLGDKHLFFWFLTNRMAPGAVFCPAVLPALLCLWPDRYAYCRGLGTLPVQCSIGDLDP